MKINKKFKHSAEHLDPAWYVGEGYLGEVVNGDKTIIVGCYGEMRIQVPDNDEPIKSTERLIKYGVTNDKELSDLCDRFADDDIWQNNAWFEVYEEDDSEGEIFYDLDEAFKYAEKLAKSCECGGAGIKLDELMAGETECEGCDTWVCKECGQDV